jgi:hypothetical protein
MMLMGPHLGAGALILMYPFKLWFGLGVRKATNKSDGGSPPPPIGHSWKIMKKVGQWIILCTVRRTELIPYSILSHIKHAE